MKIELEKANVLKAWNAADAKGKVLLENMYGKEIFENQDITDIVKEYIDACTVLGEAPINEDALLKMGLTSNDIAYLKLTTIVRALNEGWVAKVYDNEDRWYPWFYHKGSPAAFADSYFGNSTALAGSGSRLCFRTKELGDYAGKQFINLWKEFIV